MRGHPRSGIARAQVHLRKLYHGHSREALRFQMAALTVDLSIIALFILTPVLRGTEWFLLVDYAVAAWRSTWARGSSRRARSGAG